MQLTMKTCGFEQADIDHIYRHIYGRSFYCLQSMVDVFTYMIYNYNYICEKQRNRICKTVICIFNVCIMYRSLHLFITLKVYSDNIVSISVAVVQPKPQKYSANISLRSFFFLTATNLSLETKGGQILGYLKAYICKSKFYFLPLLLLLFSHSPSPTPQP